MWIKEEEAAGEKVLLDIENVVKKAQHCHWLSGRQ